jgi:hypothetical protein
MSGVSVEIQENFKQFSQTWIGELNTVSKKLEQQDKKFLQSYARLVSLQAWRKHIIEPDCSAEALEVFFGSTKGRACVSRTRPIRIVALCAASASELLGKCGFVFIL